MQYHSRYSELIVHHYLTLSMRVGPLSEVFFTEPTGVDSVLANACVKLLPESLIHSLRQINPDMFMLDIHFCAQKHIFWCHKWKPDCFEQSDEDMVEWGSCQLSVVF